MDKFLKTLLYVILYLMLFVAAAGIMTYTMDITVLTDIKTQLYIGIGALILALILICILIFASKREEAVFLPDQPEDKQPLKEEKKDERLMVNITPSTYTPAQMDPMEIIEDTIVDMDVIDEQTSQQQETFVEETVEENEEEVIAEVRPSEENNQPEQEFEKEVELAVYSREQKDETVEDDEVVIAERPVSQTITQAMISEPLHRKVSEDLSETQVIYIDSSKYSYINTAGLPQLVVTDAIDVKSVKKAAKQQKKESEEVSLKKQMQEDYEYRMEERREKINNILEKCILFVLIFILVIGLYWFYTKFIG